MKSKFISLIFAVSLASCTSYVRFSSDSPSISYRDKAHKVESNKNGEVFYGKASYYADKFQGRKTANGEKFDQNKLTAAHKSLPFGTIVSVENLNNGKKIVVKINDRGPFIRGRVIDLSKKAAEELDMIKDGVVQVKVEILN